MSNQGNLRPRAIVYVDGLNLYRSVLEKRPQHKRLNPLLLVENLIKSHDIVLVRYFTSRIIPSVKDEQAMSRQETYLSALTSLSPRLTIHFGKMRSDVRSMPIHPITEDENGKVKVVKVRKTEEKGSDVALASFILFYAASDSADTFVLLSNDSDFVPTMSLLASEMGKEIGWLRIPMRSSKALGALPFKFVSEIRDWALENSQFPDDVDLGKTSVRKPKDWLKTESPSEEGDS